MNTESRLMAEGPQYRADYEEALRMLNGGLPRQLLLPAPSRPPAPPLHPFTLPVVEHDFNPDSRDDVLSLVRIVKTPKPGLRAVLYDGVLVGKIARNPYGVGWMASCTRSLLYWSAEDAALALVEDVGGSR